MAPPSFESAVYPFEGLLPDLESPPIAARRALDHAGLRLSVEGWRSLSADERQKLTLAGVAERVDAERVASLLRRASPAPKPVTSVSDPDATAPPEALAKALEPSRSIDPKRWARLRSVDRYALAHTYRRAVARSAFSLLTEALDAVLAQSAAPYDPRPDGGYAQRPADAGYAQRSTEAGYAPKPADGAYAPRSLDGGYVPRTADGGYGQKSAEGGYAPRSTEGAYAPRSPWAPATTSASVGSVLPPPPSAAPGGGKYEPAGYYSSVMPPPGEAEEGPTSAPEGPGSIPFPHAGTPTTRMRATPSPPASNRAGSAAVARDRLSSHLTRAGEVHLADVARKPKTERRAVATGSVWMQADALARLTAGDGPRAEVLATARLAGIMAAKRTHEIIPLCPAITLTHLELTIEIDEPSSSVTVTALVDAYDRTGCDMEAMVAVSTACLTLYDMLKGVDRGMVISEVKLMEKSGGRSGHYVRAGQ